MTEPLSKGRKRDLPGRQAETLIEPGQVLNPAGRPKGSRNKLSEAFIEAMCADFEEHGAAVIARVREKDPAAYLKVIASLLPKEIKYDTVQDLTDEQIDARMRQLADFLGFELRPKATTH